MDDGVQGVLGWGQWTIEDGVGEDGVSGPSRVGSVRIGSADHREWGQ